MLLTDGTQPSAVYKKINTGVAIATIIFIRVIASVGEILSFASPKESIQRKEGRGFYLAFVVISYLRF